MMQNTTQELLMVILQEKSCALSHKKPQKLGFLGFPYFGNELGTNFAGDLSHHLPLAKRQ